MMGPPGRTRHQHQLPAAAVEHQRRAHARAWPLAGLHAVGHRPALGVVRLERKVGELVVEQKAAGQAAAAIGQQPGAEGGLDRGRHRHRVAVGVDDADVAGACSTSAACGAQRQGGAVGHAGRGRAHAARADQRRALGAGRRRPAGCPSAPPVPRHGPGRPRTARGRQRPAARPRCTRAASRPTAHPAASNGRAEAPADPASFSICTSARCPDDGGGMPQMRQRGVQSAHSASRGSGR
jgi:hypothetical protein